MSDQTLINRIGFFVPVPETIVEMIPTIGVNAFVLFVYLQFRTNKKRRIAFPGYDKIGEDLGGWGRRRISEAIKALEDADLVEREKRFGASTIYYLNFPDPPDMGGRFVKSPSSSKMERMEDSSSSETERHSFRNGTTVVPKRNANLDSVKQDSVKQDEEERVRVGSRSEVISVICNASGLITIPSTEYDRVEQIWTMIDVKGRDLVEAALKDAADLWKSQRTQDGRPYRITNLGWVDWALEILSGGSIQTASMPAKSEFQAKLDQMKREYGIQEREGK